MAERGFVRTCGGVLVVSVGMLVGSADAPAAVAPKRVALSQPATSAQERKFVQDLAGMGTGRIDPDSMLTASREVYGEFAPVMEIMAAKIGGMRRVYFGYVATVEGLGLNSILQPDAIDSAAEIEESLRRLGEARSAHSAMAAAIRELQQATRAKLGLVEMTPKVKETFLREFEKSYQRTNRGQELVFEYEDAIYEEIEARLLLMKARQGMFTITDGVIVFDEDADVAEFSASVARHATLAERQSAVSGALQTTVAATPRSAVAKRRAERTLARLAPGAERGPELVLTAEGAAFGGERIEMPWPLEEAKRVLGEPSSVEVVDGVTVMRWVQHGAAAFAAEGETAAWAVRFTTDGEDAAEPVFGGRVMLLGHEVKPHDTPWTLNRRLGERRFEPDDDEWLEWVLFLDGYAVSMTMRDDGLSGDVTLFEVEE